MIHRPYPEFQLECVTSLISIFRRGAIREEIRDFAKCVYDIEGAALKIFVGEPDDVMVGQSIPEVSELESCSLTDLEECHAALAQGVEECQTAGGSFGAADATEGIDPATLALFMQLAMKLIELFMNRKKNAA